MLGLGLEEEGEDGDDVGTVFVLASFRSGIATAPGANV